MVDTSSGRKQKKRAPAMGSRDALETAWMNAHADEIARNAGASAYPSLRENTRRGINDALVATGSRADAARGMAEPFTEIAENVSPLGPLYAAEDLRHAKGAGGAALAAVGMIPGLGGEAKMVKKGLKELTAPARSAKNAAEEGIKALAPFRDVDGTVGNLDNADVMFEGKSPHDFTPDQWHRFGQWHGVDNLGPKDAKAWEKSLQTVKTKSGREVSIPGGIDSKEPFTYYDLLHVKSQGINPNDLTPAQHQKVHDRMAKTMSPGGETSPERMFNQFALAQISPNQPLTPNELAVARTMVKGPKDLKKWGEMVPWRHDDVDTPKQIMKNDDGTDMMRAQELKGGKTKMVPVTKRKYYGDKIANEMGLGAGDKGGLGARGTADYTRIAETAQRIHEKPDFFRFRGDKEGGGASAANWANFVERISTQTPGLSAKTGSFGAVWQNPAMADISAVDRHMAGLFTEEMFPSKKEFDKFSADNVAEFNKTAPKGKEVKDWKKLPDAFKNDAMFGYLNQHPSMMLRGKPAKGSNSGEGLFNERVPQHMLPENAGYVSEPKKVQLISDAYKRVLAANADRANAAGQSTFSNQWMLWDRVRNRLEPHEIMFPGLERLPRMSMEQMHHARKDLSEAGYMSGTKEFDEAGDSTGLQPARELPSASRAAYFSLPVGGAVGAGALMNGMPGEEGGEAQAAPIKSFDDRVSQMAAASGMSKADVLRKMISGGGQ